MQHWTKRLKGAGQRTIAVGDEQERRLQVIEELRSMNATQDEIDWEVNMYMQNEVAILEGVKLYWNDDDVRNAIHQN